MSKHLTCVVCPLGCDMEIEKTENGFDIKGNSCPRGKKYAESEMTSPVRQFTSCVAIESETDRLLPVRTSAPIPRKKLSEAMKLVKKQKAKAPIKIGDVIAQNFISEGINLVSCKEIEK